MKNHADIVSPSLRDFPFVSTTAIFVAAVWGFYMSVMSTRVDSAVVLWLLGISIFLPYCYSKSAFAPRGSRISRFSGFFMLFLSVLVSFFGYIQFGMLFLFVATVVYFGRIKLLFAAIPALFIWIICIPNIEYLRYFISYPLRIIAASASAIILSNFGFSAISEGTSVLMDGREIAVTAACSGIEQLEAMMLLGWLIAVKMNRNTFERLAHFVTILPLIIIFNTLRLTVTLAGAEVFGDVFLSDSVHTALGIFMVLLIAVSFIAVGRLMPSDVSRKGNVK